MLKAAVIGAGSMGRNHIRIYRQLKEIGSVAVADLDGAIVDRMVQTYGVAGYVDYREMLDKERPQVVSVAVPTRVHREVALEVIARGINLLLEKPIASTIEEGQEIIEAARDRGVVLSIGHTERFNPAVMELKRRLEAGELGRPFLVRARRLGPFPPRVRDVGVVVDLATHDLDIIRWLIDSPVERIYAETERRIHTEYEDLLCGLLKFRNGTIGILDINWLTPTKIRELSITGERGMFVVNYLTQDLMFYENDYSSSPWSSLSMLRGVSEGNMTRIKIAKKEPLQVEIDSFVAAVLNGEEPAVSGEDALEVLHLALKIVESGQRGEVIRLS